MWTLIVITTFTSALGATVTLQQYPHKHICEKIASEVIETAKQKSVYINLKADRYMVVRCVENR